MQNPRRIRRHASRRFALSLLAACAALQPVLGVGARMQSAGRPVRLEGYWDHRKSEKTIIGEVVISADGRTRRQFGITAVQAYTPEEEGPQIFRHSSLGPVTLLLRGRKEMVARFLGAHADEKVTAFGLYRAGAGDLILSSVDSEPAPDPLPTSAP